MAILFGTKYISINDVLDGELRVLCTHIMTGTSLADALQRRTAQEKLQLRL